MKKCDREIRGIHVACALVAAAVMLYSAPSQAASYAFVPALMGYEGDLEVGMAYEKDENTSNDQGVKTRDMTAIERLRVRTVGYVYHPRFVLFSIGGAAGLTQENYKSSQGASRHGTGSADEYELRAFLLPEHPYNLELFSVRRNPFIKPRYSFARPVLDEEGAVFRYKQKPLTVLASATEYSTTSTVSTDSRSYRGSVGYAIGPLSNSVGYDHSDSTNSLFTKNSRNNAFFNNNLSVPFLTLVTHVGNDRVKQEDAGYAPVNDKVVTWSEQLNAELPWNFSGSAAYNQIQETRVTEETSSSLRTTVLSDSQSSFASLSHRLYESLRTIYTKNYVSIDTSSGDSRTASDLLGADYTKNIPHGRMHAGVTFGRSRTELNDTPTILDEVHAVTFPADNPFQLYAQSVDQDTIQVWVEEPSSGVMLPLTTPSQYTIESVGTGSWIIIQSNALPFPVVPGAQYRFHVSYSLLESTAEFRTETEAFRLSFDLLRNRLKPYAGYSSSVQEVLSGSLAGGADSSRTKMAGVIAQDKPFTFQTEYQGTRSLLNPSRTWKNMLEYRDAIAEASNLSARVSLVRSDYPEGAATSEGTSYTERVKSIETTMQRRIPRKNLDFFLGASYTRRDSFLTSTAITLYSTLAWQIGRLTLNAGASINEINSSYSTGKATYFTEYYYLTVNRKLF